MAPSHGGLLGPPARWEVGIGGEGCDRGLATPRDRLLVRRCARRDESSIQVTWRAEEPVVRGRDRVPRRAEASTPVSYARPGIPRPTGSVARLNKSHWKSNRSANQASYQRKRRSSRSTHRQLTNSESPDFDSCRTASSSGKKFSNVSNADDDSRTLIDRCVRYFEVRERNSTGVPKLVNSMRRLPAPTESR